MTDRSDGGGRGTGDSGSNACRSRDAGSERTDARSVGNQSAATRSSDVKRSLEGQTLTQRMSKDECVRSFEAPPDPRGFDMGATVLSRDAQGRAVMAEGWARPETGARVPSGVRDGVCDGAARELNASHLLPRSVGGPVYGNLVGAPREQNAANASFERALSQRTRAGDPLYVQGRVEYSDLSPNARPDVLELKVWTRGSDGRPVFVDGIRSYPDGRTERYH